MKETITRELLDSVGDSVGLEGVFHRYARSKEPLYLALAEATTQLYDQLDSLHQERAEAEAQKQKFQEEVSHLEGQPKLLEQEVQSLGQRRDDATMQLAEVEGRVNRVHQLKREGFGEDELARLVTLITEIAAAQGATPDEGVNQFFETVGRYQGMLSLDLEARRSEARVAGAKADAERWEAEARLKETQSKGRIAAINLIEELLDQGVKAADLPYWQKVLEDAGVTVAELADALGQYGSLEALAQARQARVDELQKQVSKLESQVEALTQERDTIHAAIQAVRDKALSELRTAKNQAKKHVDALVHDAVEYGRLREDIKAARLLRSGDPENWRLLEREIIQHFLVVAIRWTEGEGRDIVVLPPDVVH